MRLLTEHEIAVLKGDIKRIALPPDSTLYVSLGLPTVFRRIGADSSEQFEDSWLYIPLDQVKSYRQTMVVSASSTARNHILTEPIETEDFFVLPILIKGKLAGALISKEKEHLKCDRRVTGELLESLSNFMDQHVDSNDSLFAEFAEEILRYDSVFDTFIKRVLSLFTKQCPGSGCGYYYQEDGVFKLRVAVGDLTKFDTLPAELPVKMAGQWMDAIRCEEYLLPVGLVPPHPVLMPSAPDYMFVHPGVKAERTEYLIAVSFDGDLVGSQLDRLKELAGFLCRLDESQFARPADLIRICDRLVAQPERYANFDQFLVDLYDTLRTQTATTRLTIWLPDCAALIVRKRPSGSTEVVTANNCPVPPGAEAACKRGEHHLVSDFGPASVGDDVAKQNYIDNVKSELYLPVTGLAKLTVLAVSASVGGDYLKPLAPYFRHATRVISYYFHNVRRSDEYRAGSTREDPVVMTARWYKTVDKLVTGYYHNVNGLLSVIAGQGENIQGLVKIGGPLELDRITYGLFRVSQAVDEITARLTTLREICSFRDWNDRDCISGDTLLDNLPDLLQGYVQNLRDNTDRMIRVCIDRKGSARVSFSNTEVFGFLVPVMVRLLESIQMSGTIEFNLAEHDDCRQASAKLDPGMLPDLPAEQLLKSILDEFDIPVRVDERGQLEVKGWRASITRLKDKKTALQFRRELVTPVEERSINVERSMYHG